MSTPVTETVEKGKTKVAFARRAQNWVMVFLIQRLWQRTTSNFSQENSQEVPERTV